MPTTNHEQISKYIEISVATSTRSREILILIIIVSVLFFGAFWNSRQGSWINDRIKVLQAAHDLVVDEETVRHCSERDCNAVPRGSDCLSAQLDSDCQAARLRLTSPVYNQAKKYLSVRHIPHNKF